MPPFRGLKFHPRTSCSGKTGRHRTYASFAQLATDTTRKTQIYISRSYDPYLNLSIEHYLLQRTPPDSTVLFLYTNKPCIVIGRNQNPWLEVNLRLLGQHGGTSDKAEVGPLALVRRRSGGGTVFHDEGNVNYSVICPTAAFDRDIHAEMVVRALHGLGVDRAMVNQRHDIVLAPAKAELEGSLARASAATPHKISGSAYKLTRLRAVHHGTCLLSSPNIGRVSQYLKSPAKPYIKARGVDSVSSPIANAHVSNGSFEERVVAEFGKMYGLVDPIIVSDHVSEIPDVAKGLAELRHPNWIYLQTPQFTFSSDPTGDDPRERPAKPDYLPSSTSISFTARNGTITEAEGVEKSQMIDMTALVGRKLHKIEDWNDVLQASPKDNRGGIAKWLNMLFGM
ncbi:MAG: Biotin/lipoate A/B protein ligase [Claussenomyces sp. TS43310]|nr:MAG: Biotin/lipoate A/B protein ligase [Claussenomyces sp. TS43310]